MVRSLLGGIFLAAACGGAPAAPGALDTSWGSGGRATVAIGGFSLERASALAVQADGRIVAAGQVGNGTNDDFAVVRFNPDGSPDLGFGNGGKVLAAFNNGHDAARAIAIQPDGRIVVVGGSSAENSANGSISILRLDAYGGLDTTFGSGGYVATHNPAPFGAAAYAGQSVALQADGKIVVGGIALGGSASGMLIARYRSNGTLDDSFGATGLVVTPFDTFGGYRAVAVQPDGRIVAVGMTRLAGNPAFAVVRYTADGSLDPTFGTGGKAIASYAPDENEDANAIALQPDGRILVAAESHSAILRFNADGTPDNAFGIAGRAIDLIGPYPYSGARSVAVLADGRILVAGNSANGGFTAARLNAEGTLDATYGTAGRVAHADPRAVAAAAAALPDGSLVLAGRRDTGANDDIAVMRFTPGGTVDATFGGGAMVTRDLGLLRPGYPTAVLQQADGKLLAGGIAHAGGYDKGFALARFNGDGTLDAGFGAQGTVLTGAPGASLVLSKLRLQPDGRIVAAGALFTGYPPVAQGVAVVRYEPNGSLDASFGSDGFVLLPEACRIDIATQPECKVPTVLLADGRILVAAASYAAGATNSDIVIHRLGIDGAPDATFGSGGRVVVDFQGGSEAPVGLFVRGDGRIVLVASSGAPNQFTPTVSFARFAADGAADATFGSAGKLVTPHAATDASADLLPDGKLLVAVRGPTDGFLLGRFNADGSLDTRFGAGETRYGGGGAVIGFAGTYYSDYRPNEIVRQRDGRILVTGWAMGSGTGKDVVVARFTANGRLDRSFGSGGVMGVRAPGDGEYGTGTQDYATATWVQEDGRILVGSRSHRTGGDPFEAEPIFTVFRMLGGRRPAGDFDANGTADIVVANASDGSVAQWLMDGTAIAATTSLGAAGNTDQPRLIGDFNGDGKADIAWQDADGTVSVTLFDGSTISADVVLAPAGSDWRVTHAGDLDGDGKDDLAWVHATGAIRLWLMDGVAPSATIDFDFPGWRIERLADLDGDGHADILLRHDDGTVVAFLMNGLVMTSAAGLIGPGSGWRITHVGDFDGDGKADLVWTHANGAEQAWLMDGLAAARIADLAPAGSGFTVTLTADLDGDGRDDILWRHDDGSVYASLMGPGLAIRGVAAFLGAGNPWILTHARDLDGDGKADLLWRHPDGTLGAWIMDGLAPSAAAALSGPGASEIR